MQANYDVLKGEVDAIKRRLNLLSTDDDDKTHAPAVPSSTQVCPPHPPTNLGSEVLTSFHIF